MSVINLGEIYYNTYRERGREKADEAVSMIEQLPVTIVSADMAITIEASALEGAFSVAFADCFAAAPAIRKMAKVMTGDYRMEHRHINIKQGQWNSAVIHSIWERGSEEDICALINEVRKNPAAAHAVRKAIPHSRVYGWPRFFRMYLEKVYGADR